MLFINETNYTGHPMTDDSSREGLFCCTICPFWTEIKSNLDHHMIQFHSNLSSSVRDELEIQDENDLQEIVEKDEDTLKTLSVSETPDLICAEDIPDIYVETGLQTHQIESVSETGDKPFKCNQCTYSCKTRSRMKLHNQYVHSNIKPFRCYGCPYSSKNKRDLKNHILRLHPTNELNMEGNTTSVQPPAVVTLRENCINVVNASTGQTSNAT